MSQLEELPQIATRQFPVPWIKNTKTPNTSLMYGTYLSGFLKSLPKKKKSKAVGIKPPMVVLTLAMQMCFGKVEVGSPPCHQQAEVDWLQSLSEEEMVEA